MAHTTYKHQYPRTCSPITVTAATGPAHANLPRQRLPSPSTAAAAKAGCCVRCVQVPDGQNRSAPLMPNF
eukprot:11563-Chlamydomonas_euryale.AAC.9